MVTSSPMTTITWIITTELDHMMTTIMQQFPMITITTMQNTMIITIMMLNIMITMGMEKKCTHLRLCHTIAIMNIIMRNQMLIL